VPSDSVSNDSTTIELDAGENALNLTAGLENNSGQGVAGEVLTHKRMEFRVLK
jgi:hypothetical protein